MDFTDLHGTLFVQEGPGEPTHWLGCTDLEGTDVPVGDVTTALCHTPTGAWETTVEQQGAPSRATMTLTSYLGKTRGWLQKKAADKCPLNIYVHHTECTPRDVFNNYETGQALQHSILTARPRANQVKQRGEEGQAPTPVDIAFDYSARPGPPEYWKLVHTRRAIAESEPLRDIAFCNAPSCGGSCGSLQAQCDEGIIVADAGTGAIANTWFTTDSGATWAAGATKPFTTDEDICSCVCVHLSATQTRHIVARGTTDAGNPAEIAYSNDAGATWTNVNVGSTNGEYGLHSGALFALNHNQNYIWKCTDQGNVFFSGDAGQSWADQNAGASNGLYYVHFVDTRYGWTVGDQQEILKSTDGGAHWAAPTALPGGATDVFTCVATITDQTAFVGGTTAATAGLLYRTTDGGASWTDYIGRLQAAEGLPAGTITQIGDIDFADEYAGCVTGTFNDSSAGDVKGTWRTIDGGWNWEFHCDPDDAFDGSVVHQGGNATVICDYNHVYSVGEVSGATGTVEELSAKGSV